MRATPEEDVVQPYICTELTAEELRNEPCWFVELSNGARVYSKAGHRSWLELKQYLLDFNLSNYPFTKMILFIDGLYFQFRDNTVEVARGNYDGYFFTLGANCWFSTNITQQTFTGGYLRSGHVYRKRYTLPEIILQEEDVMREDDPNIQRGLILRG